MKAVPLTNRPSFRLMTQAHIQSTFHLQMPRWLFSDPNYKPLSLEAKVVYTFLLNRFQLSKLNGWVNEGGEVFIIYTRASLAEETQICYRRIIDIMKELSVARLIYERRCGRGEANQIYLALVEHGDCHGGSAPFVAPGHEAAGGEPPVGGASRDADAAPLDADTDDPVEEADLPRPAQTALQAPEEAAEVRDRNSMTCGNGTSGGAADTLQEVQKPHPSKNDERNTDGSDIDVSQSVGSAPTRAQNQTTDEIRQLGEILELCELWSFDSETAKVFESAIERLFFSTTFRIGDAVLPQEKVRSHLWELDNLKLQAAESKLHANTERQIRNSTAYTMAVIFNTIWECESDLLVDPYLNHLRQLPRRGGDQQGA